MYCIYFHIMQIMPPQLTSHRLFKIRPYKSTIRLDPLGINHEDPKKEEYRQRAMYMKSVSTSISKLANEFKREKWIEQIAEYCTSYGLLDVLNNPKRILRIGEYPFSLQQANSNVIDAENMTLFLGGTAAGIPTPPSVVFQQSTSKIKLIETIPNNWTTGMK